MGIAALIGLVVGLGCMYTFAMSHGSRSTLAEDLVSIACPPSIGTMTAHRHEGELTWLVIAVENALLYGLIAWPLSYIVSRKEKASS